MTIDTKPASIFVIIQARMGSTRLPGKVLKTLLGDTVLAHVVKRVAASKKNICIIIATSDKSADDAIEAEAGRLNVHCHRGSESNVLSRYYHAAKEHKACTVVRITSDCPLYDSTLLDDMLDCFEKTPCDYLSNCLVRTYPRGLDTEIFTFSALERAFQNAVKDSEKEHVTPYINQNPHLFNLKDYAEEVNHSHHRWTLDTPEDFDFITNIYNYFKDKRATFSTSDVLKYLDENPSVVKINQHIEQKKVSA